MGLRSGMGFWCALLLLVLFLAGCQTAPPPAQDAGPAFPTMTPGAVQRGDLGPPLVDAAAQANPATVIAQANLPTPTPNLAACPIGDPAVTLAAVAPSSAQAVADAISTYLSAGGSLNMLESGLRDRWGLINASESGGFVRSDLDLTGEGSPEVLVSLITPDAGRRRRADDLLVHGPPNLHPLCRAAGRWVARRAAPPAQHQ